MFLKEGRNGRESVAFKGSFTSLLPCFFWTEECMHIKPKRPLQPCWHHERSLYCDEEKRDARKLDGFQDPGYGRPQRTCKEFGPYPKHNESSLKEVWQSCDLKRLCS